jgi:hypothetical protein
MSPASLSYSPSRAARALRLRESAPQQEAGLSAIGTLRELLAERIDRLLVTLLFVESADFAEVELRAAGQPQRGDDQGHDGKRARHPFPPIRIASRGDPRA